ncbi:MAG: VIT family protein [Citrobacter freundii]|jgi:VIT1/CCC1 family predicted Fe2+/Mn2+ transporter|uniref:Membrane protein n=1 Tax=Empedobacter brevis NBRC 14943 = ATCC 43319 TaxID=1218108 RepID=A0A511NKM8_9FLAO|nr:VIT family protein [Empedobacter brevis]PZR27986.1 MAG: VIT family protein [Citrobacter freundii]GEM53362.1 membrane protein [Empedobacter brevis NBRC 14943 = ATCC 43319]HUM98660.1 VIT family protein [Chitinophagaceae bacterium]
MELEKHYVNKAGWLRAAVLGANDGILSTSSIIIGVAAASDSRETIILAALAGAIAGAMSMAAGEYVSVSSQADLENADLEREQRELIEMPEIELKELAKVYQKRGLDEQLALQVARQLTAHDALGAHARDELGINEITEAKPFQAALASFASFIIGAALPFLVTLIAPVKAMIYCQYIFSLLFLVLLGTIAANAGGSNLKKAIGRICFWGTTAMLASALVGYIFGVNIS